MSIADTLERIHNRRDCIVYPAGVIPILTGDTQLPDDLMEFYQSCGGASLFVESEVAVDISKPDQLVPSNGEIAGIQEPTGDISDYWYVIARSGLEKVVIDLAAPRLGRCYDGFWDTYGLVGQMPLIAGSFQELLDRLLGSEGDSLYWRLPGFSAFGDAYDGESKRT